MTSEVVKDEVKVENDENNEENTNNNIDFKVLFFSHPSQKDKI